MAYIVRKRPSTSPYLPSGTYSGLSSGSTNWDISPPSNLTPDQIKYITAATGPGSASYDAYEAQKNATDPNSAQNQGQAPLNPNQLPFDPIYENALGGINRQHSDTLANLGYEEGQLSPTYGYQTDNSGNISVDPSNPFSKSALLQKTYGESQARSTNSMAAQGQLYSGALQNQQNQNTFGFQQNTDALKRAYSNALQSIRSRRTSADTSQYINTNNAWSDRLTRALANRPTQ